MWLLQLWQKTIFLNLADIFLLKIQRDENPCLENQEKNLPYANENIKIHRQCYTFSRNSRITPFEVKKKKREEIHYFTKELSQ